MHSQSIDQPHVALLLSEPPSKTPPPAAPFAVQISEHMSSY
jgi:hypothetical protein